MPLHPEVVLAARGRWKPSGLRPPRSRDRSRRGPPARALLRPPTEDCFEILDIDAGGVPARMYRAGSGPVAARPARVVPRRRLGARRHRHATTTCAASLSQPRPATRCSASTTASLRERPVPGRPRRLRPTRLEWAFENTDDLGRRRRRGSPSAATRLAATSPRSCATSCRVLRRSAFELLVYPVTDARVGTLSHTENAEGYFLTASGMHVVHATSTCRMVWGPVRTLACSTAAWRTDDRSPAGAARHSSITAGVRPAARRGREPYADAAWPTGRRGHEQRPLRRADPRLLLDARFLLDDAAYGAGDRG